MLYNYVREETINSLKKCSPVKSPLVLALPFLKLKHKWGNMCLHLN